LPLAMGKRRDGTPSQRWCGRTFMPLERRVPVVVVRGEREMQQPRDAVWFVVALIAGIGILGFVLADV